MLVEPRQDDTRQEGDPRRSRAWRVAKLGCLGILLALCALLGTLVYALQAGPVSMHLVGGSTLKMGSSAFVLSNYSWQNGTTYFIDLDGNGVRRILQLHYLSDTHAVEVVMHYADSTEEGDHELASLHIP